MSGKFNDWGKKMRFLTNKKTSLKHQEPLQTQNRFALANQTPNRFVGNLLILLLIACIVALTITFRDSLIGQQIEDIKQQIFEYSTEHGFGINDIIIEGRHKTTLSALNQQINLNRNDSILKINLKDLKTKIEDLPWIEQATLKRSYFPNVLQISLKEKEIIALYQTNGKFYPVDKYGNIIDTDYIPNTEFLIITGEGAPEKLFDLLSVLQTNPELFSRIKAAVLHSSRRWDLIFDDIDKGTTVKMPENNLNKAWQKLIKINNKYGIFKRKLTFIDLRYQDKVIVNIAD